MSNTHITPPLCLGLFPRRQKSSRPDEGRGSCLIRARLAGLLIFTLLLTAVSAGYGQGAANTASPTAQVLQVLARDVEPFCFEKDGQRTGFAVELWAEICREAGFQYKLQTADSAQLVVDALAAKKADIGLGALSITSEREQVIDFSYPFYNSGLDIITASNRSSVPKLFNILLNFHLLRTFGLLLLIVLCVSHVLWLFERRANEEEFPTSYKPGIVESMWWTLTIMITLGCENKSPKSIPGRLVATVWMITGVLMISLLTASFSSSLTVSTLSGQIKGPSDLGGRKENVATVSGSTAERWLTDNHIKTKGYPTAADAIAAVAKDDAIAAVYDEPILRYLLTKSSHKNLFLVGQLFEKQGYGFGLQLGSPYHKKINQALLKLIENKTIDSLNKKWFGEIDEEKKEGR